MLLLQVDNSALGGYIELGLPEYPEYITSPYLFQSARAAFLALMLTCKPKKIWLPYFICDSIINPLVANGFNVDHYFINNSFDVSENVKIGESDVLLYVNYFGVCDEVVEKLLSRFDMSRVVLDYSQAFFSRKFQCLATIYSPRKFFGLPDGGLLVTDMKVNIADFERDINSIDRVEHLLGRLVDEPERYYKKYIESENSLVENKPLLMSFLTQRLLKSINYRKYKEKRSRNFDYLRKNLSGINHLILSDANKAPLCYPLLLQQEIDKRVFLENRIYIPTYWLDVLKRVDDFSCESKLVKNLIAIPCDHRYKEKDLERIIVLINNEVVK